MPRMESEAKFLYRGVSYLAKGSREGEFNRTFNSWVAPIRLITTRSSVKEDLALEAAREGKRWTDSSGGLPSRGAISKELTMIAGGDGDRARRSWRGRENVEMMVHEEESKAMREEEVV